MSDVVSLKQAIHDVKHTSYAETMGAPTQVDENGDKRYEVFNSDRPYQSVAPTYAKERMNYGINLFEVSKRNDDTGRWAKAVLDFLGAFHKASDENFTHQKEVEKTFRFLQERYDPSSITQEDIERRLSYEYLQKWGSRHSVAY